MIEYVLLAGLFVLGAAIGSFAAAQVWRLRAHQLTADKTQGEKVSKQDIAEVKVLQTNKRSAVSDRSVCLHCGRQLAWYELLPVVSWIVARGKCRTCNTPIGKMEILAEVGLGALFVVSYLAWPYGFETHGIVLLIIWLLIVTLLVVHWMYDAKWFLLLDKITLMITGLAALFVLFQLADKGELFMGQELQRIGWNLLALPVFYGVLYLISRGKWVGLGDVKLLIPMALLLPNWTYGVLVIFLANLIGSLVLLPAMVTKKLSKTARVPFGPFLVAAFIISFLYGSQILDMYFRAVMF